MAAPSKKIVRFTLPIDLQLFKTVPMKEVCIVALFGKSPLGRDKGTILNQVFDREIFGTCNSVDQVNQVQGVYDADNSVVVLQCLSGYDIELLSIMCENMQDFNEGWDAARLSHAKTLLFILHVSHIVICTTPGLALDTNYIRIFKALDAVRNKVQASLCDELSKLSLPKSWYLSGRPTCPRMLFVFQPIDYPKFLSACLSKDRPQLLKKLPRNLEDSLYKVLRKTRVLGNNANTSLFTVPGNQEFVYILLPEQQGDRRADMIRLFNKHCGMKSSVQATNDNEDSLGGDFKEFVMQHVRVALDTGFEDNIIGRGSSASVFSIAQLKDWLLVANSVYSLLITDVPQSGKLATAMTTLKSTIEVEHRFSETRCQKVMKLAENAYQENLPKHYTENVHIAQLMKARHILKSGGRGPALSTYLEQLESECLAHWTNGRRLCEAVSLSGNHCMHELHRLPQEPITDENDALPCYDHATHMNYNIACNCGRSQRDVGDPFTVEYANYTVYVEMAKNCCHVFDTVRLPTYSSVGSPSADTSTRQEVAKFSAVEKLKNEDDETNMSADHQSFELSLSQGRNSAIPKTEISGCTDDQAEPITEDFASGTLPEAPKCTLLPHMVTNLTHRNCLPWYSSWALTKLGSYSSYTPSTGIDQPGFLPGTSFLLPWEVIIKGLVKEHQSWPSVGETSQRQRKKQQAKKHVVDTTARIYIGDEYACPLGHRFMCSGPDKVVKVNQGSTLKDNANKLLTMDMPLFYVCPCNTGSIAQLRRMFIATPEIESLLVKIFPKIQPAPVPCPLFIPTADGPIKLQPNSLYVLRLPHVYVDDTGPYPLPKDSLKMGSCRLLKGAFSIVNTSEPIP